MYQHNGQSERLKLVSVFEQCISLVNQISQNQGELVNQSMMIDGKEFVYQTPDQINAGQINVNPQDLQTTLKTLNQIKEQSMNQSKQLAEKIADIEAKLKQPYICTKERPYYLHAIMIHDGVAENGHYYAYVYDRVLKRWWKLNDHQVSMELEQDVFRVAFGDGIAQANACNMFYISKHIADQIDKYQRPLFTEDHAQMFSIDKQIKQAIQKENNYFSFNQQQFIVQETTSLINQTFKDKINMLEEKQNGLVGIEEVKLHSFFHFLKILGFKGYGKWMTLNQCFKEHHPQHLDLLTIVSSPDLKMTDLIYQKLQDHFQEKFMILSKSEFNSLQSKQVEFREILKKAEIIIYMMQHLDSEHVKEVFQVITTFSNKT